MQHQRSLAGSMLGALALFAAPGVQALEIQAGDWKFSFNGNVNVHYINAQCDDTAAVVAGGLACNAGVGTDAEDGVSTVSNGLLPAAFVFGASTVQSGWDLSANLGLYPGISTNDGGSPNLQGQGGTLSNTGLGTSGLDVRQVFMTFGNKDVGTFMLGRNFGLFGFDAIINDMTIPGVGVAGGMAGPNPANTSLGSIGIGYIYTDTLGQMNYTTPDFGGMKFTLGLYDALEPLNAFTGGVASTPDDPATPLVDETVLIGSPAAGGDATPGVHGKLTYTQGAVYLSASFLMQENSVANETGSPDTDFDTKAFDVGGKLSFGPAEFLAWYYAGSGVGTTALLFDATDNQGGERDSDGFLVQATVKLGATKLGVNYGESNLDLEQGDGVESTSPIVEKNSKYTLGAYHSLTPNLTLLVEFSDVQAEAHNGDKLDSSNFNLGAFLAF